MPRSFSVVRDRPKLQPRGAAFILKFQRLPHKNALKLNVCEVKETSNLGIGLSCCGGAVQESNMLDRSKRYWAHTGLPEKTQWPKNSTRGHMKRQNR